MEIRCCSIILIVLVLIGSMSITACTTTPHSQTPTFSTSNNTTSFTSTAITTMHPIDSSIVQVWQKDPVTGTPLTFMANGVAVGDGSMVLTVFNYEEYTPDHNLMVIWPGHGNYSASLQAIYPMTGATLLDVPDLNLPVAAISEADVGEPVTISGWWGDDANLVFRKTQIAFPGYDSVFFEDTAENPGGESIGAVVIKKDGQVAGLVSAFHTGLAVLLGGPGMTPPIIDVQIVSDLMSSDAGKQPWAKGPAYSLITLTDSGSLMSYEPPKTDYIQMTMALNDLLNTAGEPLPQSELPTYYRSFIQSYPQLPDGISLSSAYPRPVELHNTKGQLVAMAKWVGIQWARSGSKPNRIFYGSIKDGEYIVEGGFFLEGNISNLEQSVQLQ